MWHALKTNVRADSCEICDSKRKYKIRRGAFIKVLPFTSRKEFCKNCKNKYLILIIFNIRIVVLFKEKERVSYLKE